MLSANAAIPGVVISTLNNNIMSTSQVHIFTSPTQIASYMSMEARVGSIVIGPLLAHHNCSKPKENPEGAVSEQQRLVCVPTPRQSKYLSQYTHRRFGLEPMIIIFSLPWALLM